MRTTIAIVAAATLWPVILSAADVETEREKKWKKDIAACVEVVNKRYWPGAIDAYATPNGGVSYFGGPGARFQFEKCLAEKGHYLTDK